MRTVVYELASPQENKDRCLGRVTWKMEKWFAPVNCWLELQVAIHMEGLVGQDKLLARFNLDL